MLKLSLVMLLVLTTALRSADAQHAPRLARKSILGETHRQVRGDPTCDPLCPSVIGQTKTGDRCWGYCVNRG
ncbi:uncharacterized protein [Bemisia tabaci]|uniref:Uncharacterized protein n=1 Tax=Bemisia tabaci TaxID=7038 RepID=A0A9E7VCP5_BEMTA|nr:hypothetical protein [Bemisia tabaci]